LDRELSNTMYFRVFFYFKYM